MSTKPRELDFELMVAVLVGGIVAVAIMGMAAVVGHERAECVATCTTAGHAPAACEEACK